MVHPSPLLTFLAWFDTQPPSVRIDLASFTDFMLGASTDYCVPALAYKGETSLRCWLERERSERRGVIAAAFLLRSFLDGFFFAELKTCWVCTPVEVRAGVAASWTLLRQGALSDAALVTWFRSAESEPASPQPQAVLPKQEAPSIPHEVQHRILARWPVIGIAGSPQNLGFLAAFAARGALEDPVDLADEVCLALLFSEPRPEPPTGSAN